MYFDIWTIVCLVIMAPFAVGTIAVVGYYIFKIIRNIYIHARYGLDYTDQEDK